jgi:cyclopropane fatty-acyl-phospholipid synthase-like methyltransferase
MAIPSYTHGNPLVRWLMWRRYEAVAALAGFTRNDTVLEFGCGIGVFLPELDRTCKAVFAIDLFPEYAKHLAAGLGLNTRFSDRLSDLPDGSIDAVVAADVLEHFEEGELDAVLSEFHRILTPRGRLVVSGPTENALYRAGRILAGFFGKGLYHHSNIRLILSRIEANGYTVRNRRQIPFSFMPPLFIAAECEK